MNNTANPATGPMTLSDRLLWATIAITVAAAIAAVSIWIANGFWHVDSWLCVAAVGLIWWLVLEAIMCMRLDLHEYYGKENHLPFRNHDRPTASQLLRAVYPYLCRSHALAPTRPLAYLGAAAGLLIFAKLAFGLFGPAVYQAEGVWRVVDGVALKTVAANRRALLESPVFELVISARSPENVTYAVQTNVRIETDLGGRETVSEIFHKGSPFAIDEAGYSVADPRLVQEAAMEFFRTIPMAQLQEYEDARCPAFRDALQKALASSSLDGRFVSATCPTFQGLTAHRT